MKLVIFIDYHPPPTHTHLKFAHVWPSNLWSRLSRDLSLFRKDLGLKCYLFDLSSIIKSNENLFDIYHLEQVIILQCVYNNNNNQTPVLTDLSTWLGRYIIINKRKSLQYEIKYPQGKNWIFSIKLDQFTVTSHFSWLFQRLYLWAMYYFGPRPI